MRCDEVQTIVAGVHGWTWGRSAWVDVMWVAKDLRSTGTGSSLLDAVETEARTRGCLQIALATHTFQGRRVYERHDFEVVGYLDQSPAGHGEYFMRKVLR